MFKFELIWAETRRDQTIARKLLPKLLRQSGNEPVQGMWFFVSVPMIGGHWGESDVMFAAQYAGKDMFNVYPTYLGQAITVFKPLEIGLVTNI